MSDWLRQHQVKRVGIEASGGYEQAVVAELRRKRFVVVVFQPAQVRAYAKFHLQRAKNDKIDAALIAACTAAVKKIHAAAGSAAGAVCRASDADRADRRGHRPLKNRLETCRDARIQKLWKRGDRSPPSARRPSSRRWWRRSASIAISPSGSI